MTVKQTRVRNANRAKFRGLFRCARNCHATEATLR
jgi:hypothetical protein